MTNVFAVDQANYQFQEEDGDQNNATLLGTQGTALSRNVTSDSNIQLRIRLNESGAGNVNGATTDDYQLQVSIAGGAFANVTTTSTGAKCNTASQVVDGGSATARLGASASGLADDQNGIVDNMQIIGNASKEAVWGLTLVAADLANGQAVTFRVLLNGAVFTATAGGAYTVTPTLNITKGFTVTAEAGSYALTGTAAALEWNHKVTADVGSYALTGTAAALAKPPTPVAALNTNASLNVDTTYLIRVRVQRT